MKSAKDFRIKSSVNHSRMQSCITLLMLCMTLMLALPGHAQLLVPGQPDPINLTFLGDNSSLYVCTKGGTGTKSSDTAIGTTSKGKKSGTVSAASTNLSTVSSTSCVLPPQDSLTLTTENDLPNAITSFGNDASFINLSMPLNMVAGQSYDVAVSMKNSGNTTWQPGTWKLGSQAPQDNTIWGPNRVQLAAPVGPGGSVAFFFTIRAPTTPGIYTYKWQMVQEFVEFFGASTTVYQINVTAPPPPAPTLKNGASLINLSVPLNMVTGQSYNVAVSMNNSGTTTWQPGIWKLGSQAPQDNTIWGPNRVQLAAPVGPGSSVAFSFVVRAPTTPGIYTYKWQMVQEFVEFFGASTTEYQISVTAPLPPPPPAPVPTLTVTRTPTTMVANQSFTLNWSTTNATSLTRVCTSTGTGFVANGTLATSGSAPGTASSAWVGFSSTCTWTATGAGGSKQVIETMTTNAAAPPPPPPSGPTVTYIHTDGLGSPVARTNEKGELISRTRYEPYGATAGGATPGIGFTGHVNDPETGLTYMQQRYYDPLAGRFMSVDPVLTDANTGASFNRYVYALNSPYRYIDPDGRDNESPYCLTGGGCNKYSGSGGSSGRNGAVAKGAAIGTGLGVAVAAVCDVGTGGVCVVGNPLIVATGTLLGGVTGGIVQTLSEKFGGANNTSASPPPPDNEGEKKGKSPNQLNTEIKQGKAPKDVERVDVGKVKGEQTHTHFKDGSALNKDGTWKHGESTLSRSTQKWLVENGWKLPE
jgi:RHS repeat-associated protein